MNYRDYNGLWAVKLGFNAGIARIFWAGGGSAGVFFGTRRDGSFGFGTYQTVSLGAGVGVDLSVGGSLCPSCSVEDLAGNSVTVSGKKIGGVEVSVPFEDNGGPLIEDDLQLDKWSIGFSYGASAEATITVDATQIQDWSRRQDRSREEDANNGPSTSVVIEDVPTYDPDLLARGYYGPNAGSGVDYSNFSYRGAGSSWYGGGGGRRGTSVSITDFVTPSGGDGTFCRIAGC